MVKIDKIDTDALIDLQKANPRVREAIRVWFYKLGADLTRTAFKESSRVPRQGRRYRVKNPVTGVSFNHTASRPGESPADMFGVYSKGLGFKVTGGNQMVFGDTAPYAAFLELGTGSQAVGIVRANRKKIAGASAPEKSGMSPRPGLGIAIESNGRHAYRDALVQIKIKLEIGK